jgi:hypothetical protein
MTYPLIQQIPSNDNESFLAEVIMELTIARKGYLKANPIVRIQRWWRGYYRRKHRKWEIVNLPPRTAL